MPRSKTTSTFYRIHYDHITERAQGEDELSKMISTKMFKMFKAKIERLNYRYS